MLKYKFLRKSFLASLLITIALPLYTILFTFPAFTHLLTEQTEANAIRIASHLSRMVLADDQQGGGDLAISDALKAEIAIVSRDFNVMKHRIFSPSGVIIDSSAGGEVGDINDKDYYHNRVAKGQVFTKVVAKDRQTMEGQSLKIDVVETYVPIQRQGTFLGAFEIYFDITGPMTALREEMLRSSAVLIGISAGFLIMLVFIRRIVVRPISKMTLAMDTVARGRLNHQVPVIGQDELGNMAAIFNRMTDELRKMHIGFTNEKNKLTTILLGAREGIVVTDPEDRVVLVNPAVEALLGKTEKQIVEGGFRNLLDDPAYVDGFLQKSGVDIPDMVVFNGHVLNFHAASIFGQDGQKIGSAAMLRDITEEKRLEEQLRELSNTDGLTGLFNRRRFDEILSGEFERAVRYGSHFGLLLLDVDHFKKFNDTHGHDQGDRVLQFLARVMKEHFRNVDYCCRYGGEEFCVVMPATISPGIVDAAERFRQKVADAVVDGLRVTISVGVAIFPDLSGTPTTVEAMVQNADKALYEAKRAGRNQVKLAGV